MLLSGDAGIGKSRLVQSTRERIGPDATVLRYQCSPLHQDTALFPVIQQLMRSIGLVGEQSDGGQARQGTDWLPSGDIDADGISAIALPSPGDQVDRPSSA